METDKMQQLITDYVLDMLDEDERSQAQHLVETDPQANALFFELKMVTDSLNLSVPPTELPPGSLNRLRQKARMSQAQTENAGKAKQLKALPKSTSKRTPNPLGNFLLGWRNREILTVGFLAILVLIFGGLWIDAHNQNDKLESQRQQLALLLASPDLKETQLKPTNGGDTQAVLRLYSDQMLDKARLFAQNLKQLPSDKTYEVWFFTADQQPYQAGLLGAAGKNEPFILSLATNGKLPQYITIAITIEQQNGVQKPTNPPILVGTITG